MAFTRARLSFQVPWRRGSDAPVEPTTSAAPVVDNLAFPPDEMSFVAEASSSRDKRSAPQRGPDGRFVRRPVAPEVGLSATMVATASAEPEIRPRPDDGDPPDDPPVSGDITFVSMLRPDPPDLAGEWKTSQLIRIVLVEDVPEVAVHIREILRPHPRFKLVHVISDGRRAVEEITDLEPDVVLVDALLQGRTDSRTIVERLRGSGSRIGIVALTVPDHTVDAGLAKHADGILSLPFGILDISRAIVNAHAAFTARDPSAGSRTVAVFSAKGGVGKTTIALNLAASLAATGLRTLLLDGCLQFGDVRRLLRADPVAPSICDVPTDCVRGSDLADAVMRHVSGMDVLLAPPRPELADLVTSRDLDRVLDVLRRAYQAVVIDTPSSLSEPTLGLLDAADVIIDVVTADPVTIESTRMIAATFAEVGYPAGKVRYLVNRFDAVGAVPVSQLARAIGRAPDYTVASDWQLVSSSNVQGLPFVLARPDAPVSVDLRRVADGVRALAVSHAQTVNMRRVRSA